MAGYEAKLPDGVTLPAGYSVDTKSERYREFEALATRHGLSQAAFSETLGIEAKRVALEHERTRAAAPAAAAPAAPAPAKRNFAAMSTREKFAYAVTPRSDRGG
jgi:hypothetical protein